MNTSSVMSSRRNQRILFWVGAAVLVAGIVLVVVKFAGGSDTATKVQPDKGFKPVLPAKTAALKTASGGSVSSYEELPADVKQAIVGFMPGVLHNNYGASWKYTAPNITHGASQHKWATVDARSIVPLPGYTLDGVTYRLEEATTKEVLVSLTLQPSKPSIGRPTPMRIGLRPFGTGSNKRWLVTYWMPATNNAAVPYNG